MDDRVDRLVREVHRDVDKIDTLIDLSDYASRLDDSDRKEPRIRMAIHGRMEYLQAVKRRGV